MPRSYRFRSEDELFRHFDNHGSECAAADMDEYERKARAFLNRPIDDVAVLECVRQDGMTQRYDTRTNEFILLAEDGPFIVTYFRPVPRDVADAGGPFNTRRVRAWGLAYF